MPWKVRIISGFYALKRGNFMNEFMPEIRTLLDLIADFCDCLHVLNYLFA
jgi:hypothetical protein